MRIKKTWKYILGILGTLLTYTLLFDNIAPKHDTFIVFVIHFSIWYPVKIKKSTWRHSSFFNPISVFFTSATKKYYEFMGNSKHEKSTMFGIILINIFLISILALDKLIFIKILVIIWSKRNIFLHFQNFLTQFYLIMYSWKCRYLLNYRDPFLYFIYV